MNYAKPLLLFGAMIILGSSAAFEWATLSDNFNAYQVPPIALLGGLVGLVTWLAGCVLIGRRMPADTLFGAGGLMLILMPVAATILDHINPVFFNVHGGFGGMMAPILACLLGGLIFLVAGVVRLARK